MSGFDRRTLLTGAAVGAAGIAALGAAGCTPGSEQSERQQERRPIRTADVIVIGAGLSGLNAAHLLEELGHQVVVLEGRERVGGRLYTMDDVPGAPEAGGSGIGSGYGRILGAMDRLKVARRGERDRTEQREGETFLNIGGQNILPAAWPGHPANPFPAELRDKLPWEVQYAQYAKDNPLVDPAQFVDPQFARFDKSVADYFLEQGYSREAMELFAGTNMSYGDESGPYGLSLLMFFNIIAFGSQNAGATLPGSPFAVVGGNQRLPEAMAKALNSEVYLDAKVTGIRDLAQGAEVHLADGRIAKAKRVIVTAPFSALNLIDLDAPMTDKQARAIRTLGYTSVTHLHYVPTRAFWEDDGLPPSIWSDGPIARFMALRNDVDDPAKITSFIAFANDRTANHLDRLGAEDADAYLRSYLARIRPSTKGALEFVKFWSWQLDPFAGGAYAAWKPGQLSGYGGEMAMPAGHIHFAGEHTARAARGMEGAMESGERAAFEVDEALRA